MKILIVRMYADCLNIKNYNCQELGLAKALIRKGNICDIVLYTDREPYEEDIIFDNNKKIHIYYLNAKNILKNCFFEKKLYKIIDNYDVVQTAEYDQISNIKLKKKVGNKLVIYHGPYASQYTKGYNKKCLISDLYYFFHKKYKNTICLSKSTLATDFLHKKGFTNVKTVGVGLDDSRFDIIQTMDNEKIKNIKAQKNTENLKYLLYVGKIEDRRNITFIINIFDELLKENENIRLIMVGKGKKKYVEHCFDLLDKKHLTDSLIYFEALRQEELTELYKCCDIFLLPTQYEIFGMVLLEAMYFGIPVVTTLNGGSSTLIENEKNGFICSSGEINDWKEKISTLLHDDELMEKVKKYSHLKIKEEYTWHKIVDKFIETYNKCYNKK